MNRHLTFQQISASLDEELSGGARELVERHLTGCAGCDAVMERLVRLDAELLAVIADDPGEPFFEDVMAMVRGKTEALTEAAMEAERSAGMAAAIARAPAEAKVEVAPVTAAGPRVRSRIATPRNPSRLTQAWIAALGVLAIPVIALVVFGLLNTAPMRELRTKFQPAGWQGGLQTVGDSAVATDDANQSAAIEPVAAPEPAPVEPVPAPPPAPPSVPERMPERQAEPVAVVVPPPGEKPARKTEPEPVVRGEAQAPIAPWTTRVEKRVEPAPARVTELGMLCGEVRDADGSPVAGARVAVAEMETVVLTDSEGRFCMSVPVGQRTLSVRAAGFASQTGPVSVMPRTLERMVVLARATR